MSSAPADTFMAHYLEYARHNEAPLMFHIWGGFTCVSAAVSRKVWLPKGDEALYPNIYTMYVGGAGNGKSHAMGKVRRLLAELPDVTDSVTFSVETVQGYLRYITGDASKNPPIPSPVKRQTKWPDGNIYDYHPMTVIANEFINFIGKDQEGWIAMLNDIYDQDRYGYRTKNMGQDFILGPYLVLLGALTTQVSFALQKAKIIESGFARRTFFQYGERDWDNPHAIPSNHPGIEEERKQALVHLRRIQNARGAFFWSQDTQDWWEDWYGQHNKMVKYKPSNVQGWFSSKPDQALKLAMLCSLSESNELVVNIEHIKSALHYIDVLEQDLHRVFGGVGRNELASVATNILALLESTQQPWTIKGLRNQFFDTCRGEEFDICIQHLIDDGKLLKKTLVFGPTVTEEIIATPRAIQSFSEAIAQRSDVAQIATFLDCVPSLHRLAERLRSPEKKVVPSTPDAAPPANGNGAAVPRWQPKEEG